MPPAPTGAAISYGSIELSRAKGIEYPIILLPGSQRNVGLLSDHGASGNYSRTRNLAGFLPWA
jgi:hypothetical protein